MTEKNEKNKHLPEESWNSHCANIQRFKSKQQILSISYTKTKNTGLLVLPHMRTFNICTNTLCITYLCKRHFET